MEITRDFICTFVEESFKYLKNTLFYVYKISKQKL